VRSSVNKGPSQRSQKQQVVLSTKRNFWRMMEITSGSIVLVC